MRTGTSLRIGYVAAAVLDTYLASRGSNAARRLRFLTKPTLMPLLAASHRARTAGRTDLLNTATLAAQGASWAGDLALLGTSPTSFRLGVGSFGLAHVAYSAGFLSRRDPRRLLTQTPGMLALARSWATSTPVLTLAAMRKDRSLGGPVAAYSSLLSSTVGTALLVGDDVPGESRASIVGGSAVFLLSDLTLGIREFLLRNPGARGEAVVMATYTAAQLLISESVIRAGRDTPTSH